MPSILQIFGLAVIAIGATFIFWPAGLIVAGAACVLVGATLEMGQRGGDK